METIHRREAAAARRRYALVLLAMLAALVGATLLSFWIGYYPLSPGDVVRAFLSRFGVESSMDPNAVTIFWNIRLPRILSAVFIGASLSANITISFIAASMPSPLYLINWVFLTKSSTDNAEENLALPPVGKV